MLDNTELVDALEETKSKIADVSLADTTGAARLSLDSLILVLLLFIVNIRYLRS